MRPRPRASDTYAGPVNNQSTVDAEPARPLRRLERDELVTGEAVLLEIPSASLPGRLASGIIDFIVAMIGLTVTNIVFSLLTLSASEATAQTVALLNLLAWTVIIPITVETVTRGRTLGKLIMKQRTVRDDGGPIVFRHALVRGLVGFVEVFTLLGVPAALAAMFTVRARRLGDLAAGTYVVREATQINLMAPAQMPYHLAGWAQQADIAALPDGVALGIRQYLGRLHTLTPAARHTVGQSLLAQVLPLVAPQPPAGSSQDAVLAAVLSERRRRDGLRLAREHDIRHRLLPADRL